MATVVTRRSTFPIGCGSRCGLGSGRDFGSWTASSAYASATVNRGLTILTVFGRAEICAA
jgi:hypothetical protein